jgi:hypothetical protein
MPVKSGFPPSKRQAQRSRNFSPRDRADITAFSLSRSRAKSILFFRER